MSDELIDIDVRLLLLRHGRQKVFAALARLVEQTPEQIDEQIRALSQKAARSGGRREQPSLIEVAASAPVESTKIREPLRALAVAFENRAFLPKLRDVQRFLERVGAPSQKLKSRADAGMILIRALSQLSVDQLNDQLEKLASRNASGGESDFALLSRAIIGGPSNDEGKTG